MKLFVFKEIVCVTVGVLVVIQGDTTSGCITLYHHRSVSGDTGNTAPLLDKSGLYHLCHQYHPRKERLDRQHFFSSEILCLT
jgi:hypothetical protein